MFVHRKQSKKARAPKKAIYDIFGILSEDEELPTASPQQGCLSSSLTNKVANGAVRRVADIEGDYFVELRVYHSRDATVRNEDRWKKALLALKLQIDGDSVEWQHLQQFTKAAKRKFRDAEAKFYSDKINFK